MIGTFATIFEINNITQTISEDQISLLGTILMILILIVMIINLAISLLIIIVSFYETIKAKWRSRRKKNILRRKVREVKR